MKKNIGILLLLVLLNAVNAWAGNPSIQVEQKIMVPQTPEIQEKEEYPKYMEDTYIFVRSGSTVGRFPDPDSSSLFSFGLRRLPSNFFYGVEYTTYTSASTQYEAKAVQGVLGYRIIWNNRFLPYGMIQFGSASFTDKSQVLSNSSGIATTVDIGVDFLKIMKIKFGTGIRHSNFNFNSKDMPNASFIDLYGIVGLEF